MLSVTLAAGMTALLHASPIAALTSTPADGSAPTRRFHVEQRYEVKPAAPGSKAVLFAPLPQDDPWQVVTGLTIEGGPFEIVHDAAEGNAAAVAHLSPGGGTLHVSYDIVRRERGLELAGATGRPAPDGYARWLRDDRLVKAQRVRAIAAEVTTHAATPLDKAKAIYAYVLGHMRYLKQGEGWGQGSLEWACDKSYGNCTDFHSLLIGLLRASGIPARFQIGYSVPPDSPPTAGGELAGYHCWADFYLDGVGWVPVDASEAWKAPSKRDYFFGHHDANRFALSTGRDLVFPGMAGPALNFFVYPYLEVDGRPAPELVSRKTTFSER
jgi:transglutaminase-like putative cysteine protease